MRHGACRRAGELMMLPADMVLVRDPEFRKHAEVRPARPAAGTLGRLATVIDDVDLIGLMCQVYAKDEAKFAADFAKAFRKLQDLGVPTAGAGAAKVAAPAKAAAAAPAASAGGKAWWQFWK